MVLCGLVVRVRLHSTFLLCENKLQFAKDLCLRYGGCTRHTTSRLLHMFVRSTFGPPTSGTYSIVTSAAAPDVLLDGELRYYTKKLPAIRSTVAPSQEHFLHLAAGRGVDSLVRLDKEISVNVTEVARIGIIDVLGDGVKEIE